MTTRMNYENTHDKAADDSINRGKVLMYIADMQQGVSGEYSDPVEAEKHEYAYQVLEWVFAGIKEMEPAEMPGPSDTISRKELILKLLEEKGEMWKYCMPCKEVLQVIEGMPSAQPERDKPMKPKETTDRAWGIPLRQAVCPKCDYYLGHVAFLGDYKGKKVTYCETCGQAIDWEGWEFEE